MVVQPLVHYFYKFFGIITLPSYSYFIFFAGSCFKFGYEASAVYPGQK